MGAETIPCPSCVGVGSMFNGQTEVVCEECEGNGTIEVWFDEDALFEDNTPQDLDLLLNNGNFEEFDENKHTEL